MKKIFLVILNWNGWRMTLSCLESLERVRCDDFSLEIVVVDNGSTDDSVEKLKTPASSADKQNSKLKTITKNLKFIENKENLGFTGGNNAGIRYALENDADYVCLLNNDTRVDPDFLEELFKVAESGEKIGLVGGKIYFERGYEFHKSRYNENELGKVIWYAGGAIDWNNVYASHRGVDEVDNGQFENEGATGFVTGCLVLVKKQVFEKVGLLDNRYFLYLEDLEFSRRTKNSGFELFFTPKAKIWHLNSGSSGSGSSLHDYFTTRNRLIFGMKYALLKSKVALIKESFKLLFFGRQWQKIGVRDFYLRKFGKGSWK